MRIISILFFLLFLLSTVYADFETSLIKTGIELATKPTDFLVELNTDMANTTPVPFDKNFQFSTSLVMDLFTIVNGQVKYRVYKEEKMIPEITPGLSYWNIIALHFLPKDDFEASASGFTPFITVAKKIENDIKFFGGAQYSLGSVNLQIKNIEKSTNGLSLDLSSVANIKAPYNEIGFYCGINYLRVSGNEVSALIGYYPGLKKIFSKVQVSTSAFDYGLSFYPDSFLLLHLYWNLHISL